MFTDVIVVSGMHCQHCVASVTEEIEEQLPGVQSVEIDLPTGRTVVSSDQPIEPGSLRKAVELAGFQTLEVATR